MESSTDKISVLLIPSKPFFSVGAPILWNTLPQIRKYCNDVVSSSQDPRLFKLASTALGALAYSILKRIHPNVVGI